MNANQACEAQAEYAPLPARDCCEGLPVVVDLPDVGGCVFQKIAPPHITGIKCETMHETILAEAARITSADRNKTYGPPRDNHSRTAALWSAYLGVPITYRQVCWMNVLQKASRDVHKPGRDNLVDGAGFLRNIEMADNDEGR